MRRLKGSNPAIALKKLRDAYAALDSYQDRGFVRQVLGKKDKSDTIEFETYFKRPNFFRFAWRYGHSKETEFPNFICSDGSTVIFYETKLSLFKKMPSINLAIASASPCTWGAAHTVPQVLFEEVKKFGFSDLQDLQSLASQELDGEPCLSLRGTPQRGVEHRLWISERDFLLRRLESTSLTTIKETELLSRMMTGLAKKMSLTHYPAEYGDPSKIINRIEEIAPNLNLTHDSVSTLVESHFDIAINREIPMETFSIHVPKGTKEQRLFEF